MKILIATPYIPYPLSHGGSVAQHYIIDYIRNYISITLVLIVTNEKERESVSELKKIWENVSIEVIDLSHSPSYLQRISQSIRQVKRKLKPTKTNSFTITVGTDTILYWPKSEFFINTFTQIISKVNPDLVQIDFLTFIDLVLLIPKGIKSVFVHHELRFAKMESVFATQKAVSPIDQYYYNETKTRELAFLKLYDSVVVFSDIDKQKLNNLSSQLNVSVSPFAFGNFSESKSNVVLDERIKRLIFIGGDGHHANVDAIQWYNDDIVLEVSKISSIPLHIIGNWKKENIEKFKSSNIYFDGFVEDISTYAKDSIMIVPVRIGSGIRTKILDAMALGIPLVTTSIGCEGISGQPDKDFVIGDSPKEIAEMIKKLEDDFEFRCSLVRQATKSVNKNYSAKSAGALRLNYLKEVYKS